ncbi:MAG: hypothetical protein K9K88_11360 [Desulfobacterales bacterium]|nr:hypothetical protein [Desulfobacterales bacterium]
MTLEHWAVNGWLKAHSSSPGEISDLLGVADRDLKDSVSPGLSSDWRLAIAYNAALQCATAALAAAGFRASREAHHYRAIQSLSHTVGLEPGKILVLDRLRKKRNIGGYERAGIVTEKEADEAVELAKELRHLVEAWILERHAELIED